MAHPADQVFDQNRARITAICAAGNVTSADEPGRLLDESELRLFLQRGMQRMLTDQQVKSHRSGPFEFSRLPDQGVAINLRLRIGELHPQPR